MSLSLNKRDIAQYSTLRRINNIQKRKHVLIFRYLPREEKIRGIRVFVHLQFYYWLSYYKMYSKG
jgi:hypothetical protein